MVNIKKSIKTSSIKTKNLCTDIFIPINRRNGFLNNKIPNVPVYFYRYIGICEDTDTYYKSLLELNEKLTSFENLYLNFSYGIPVKALNTNLIQIPWKNFINLNSVETSSLIKTLKKQGLLPHFNNSLIDDSIFNSLDTTLTLYAKNEPNITETLIKNFIIKLLGWTQEFLPKLFVNYNYNFIQGKDIINPKILFYGEIKKHEIYFLIFLYKLGFDVIYVNSLLDLDFYNIDKETHYSNIINLPKTCELEQINFIQKPNNTVNQNIKDTIEISPNNKEVEFNINPKKCINTILKDSVNIFNDVMLSLNERIGYIKGTAPFVPIYFYRYIGTQNQEDAYYNDIFRLNKKLSNLNSLYLRFIDTIPIKPNTKLILTTQDIWQHLESFAVDQSNKLVQLLLKNNIFPTNNKELKDSMANNFKYILDLYCIEEKTLNLSKIKNFSLKILGWIYDFVPTLMKNYDFQNTTSSKVINPKVMYYGNIKKHELLFLIFLSKLGCDILYINSCCDNLSENIENSNIFSKVLELPNKCELKKFPKEEVLIRQETIALKASIEIANALYTNEDGFYKPWQFEEFKTRPTTLKTTYSELQLLWNEPCSLRTGFKVENNTVYIPNLFSKISGVHSDLFLYWKDFFKLKSSENTLFIPEIPFTKVTFSNNHLYLLAFVFDTNGLLDKEKLQASNFYKFSYLKTALQDTIIEKINYLMQIDMLKKAIDKDFKLKILMTILNLDKELLRLIQQFDYPSKPPKIIIYSSKETIFSDEDAIVLCFLNLFGFDIVILTPTAYNNIEEKIHTKFYDTHKLEGINFNLQLPNFNEAKKYMKDKSSGFFSNIFRSYK